MKSSSATRDSTCSGLKRAQGRRHLCATKTIRLTLCAVCLLQTRPGVANMMEFKFASSFCAALLTLGQHGWSVPPASVYPVPSQSDPRLAKRQEAQWEEAGSRTYVRFLNPVSLKKTKQNSLSHKKVQLRFAGVSIERWEAH